jgi:hypothetical protein
MSKRILPRLAAAIFLVLVPASGLAAGTATITYRKVFKSSYPEFTEIKLDQQGAGTYDLRQLDEPAGPKPFEVGPQLATRIFALAAQLHDFKDLRLDVHRRIANLGQKTFHYESGEKSYETSFNYTLNAQASELLEIFEGLARQQGHIDALERTMRYDRLGVNQTLLHLQEDLDEKQIPEPERLLPVLDQLANDPKFLDIARERARSLATRIRNPHR